MQETIIRRWERLNKLNKTFKEEKPSVVFQVILQGGPAFFQHFPGGSDSKGSACSEGNRGWISGLERSPGGGHGNPLQYSCLENPHGQRSLAGYSPWGLKELDTTERLSTKCQGQHPLMTDVTIPLNFHSPYSEHSKGWGEG